ncbi:antibiotic biosynthesis monooxygenase family protein [Paracoccus lutimaris]|uniref:Heme-degrading monooxygenase HmoA n=1 Tax=Paracoccus lutimaris TaxID=1490030 RepID=A0A368ZBQ8_9RHOB|nr:antibiotic biosynthesis monooxygenase [Paracoccus lutimaris]RCW88936.1 heme-degrading monooxygenase HmoA [Paracoccus lutimaris]
MIAVIFEFQHDHAERHPDPIGSLAAELARIPGHLSLERFESASTPGKQLSLAFFTDEDAVAQWRNLWGHRAAETEARAGHLGPYRLRMAWVSHDYGPPADILAGGKDPE